MEPLTMESVRTLIYDDKTSGRKVIAFPPELPFAPHLGELLATPLAGEERDRLLRIAVIENIFTRADALGDYLATADEPHREILRIGALAAGGDMAGLKLLYAALLTIPPAEIMVTEYVDFRNVKRVMAEIARKERSGKGLKESEEWFRKKALLLSTSHPLPGSDASPAESAWLGWSDGVRRALADPDRRWDAAIVERVKAELEALDLRVKKRLAGINFNAKERSTIFLITKADETRWRLQALEGAYQRYGEATPIIRRKLGDRWGAMVEALRANGAGAALADLLEAQFAKVHAYPHLKTGTSIMRALLMHPLLVRSQRKPDLLSCAAVYIHAAGNGILEILLNKVAAMSSIKALLGLPGFEVREKVLAIDLAKVPTAAFIEHDDMPRDVDWTNLKTERTVSYRTLVMTYMDNDNFIVELLNNPRIIAQAGVVPLIALRSRSARILSLIANRRELYTGFSNKEVPANILQNPAKVPLSSIRKFIHVRFLDKASLARLGGKGSPIREEVRREIQRYLGSLN
jgi:hypothetical protein